MIGSPPRPLRTISHTDPAVVTREELLKLATAELREAKIPSAEREAIWLLEYTLGLKELDLRVARARGVTETDVERALQLVRRRANREPLQYLLGSQELCGLDFCVTPDVLIPRPETEVLIEAVCREMAARPAPVIADIGTGSGCIAVSIAFRIPTAMVHAVDVSVEALTVAEHNADRHGVLSRIRFHQGDLCVPLRGAGVEGRLAAIVSNPPYIADDEISRLQEEVRREPRLALAGGPDGLSFYRRLIPEAAVFLEKNGLLAVEVGQGQAGAVSRLAEGAGNYYNIRILTDAGGIERVVLAVKQR